MSAKFFTTSYKTGKRFAGRHEKKASWVVILTTVLTVAYRIYTDETGSGGKSAIWHRLTADESRITALEATNTFRAGFEAGQNVVKKGHRQ